MFRHKRKPIVGEAVQFLEDGANDSMISSWFGIHPNRVREVDALSAHTLDGRARRVHRGNADPKPDKDGRKPPPTKGDWLIRTKSGGLYVCDENQFDEHYMKMEEFVPSKRKKTDAD